MHSGGFQLGRSVVLIPNKSLKVLYFNCLFGKIGTEKSTSVDGVYWAWLQ